MKLSRGEHQYDAPGAVQFTVDRAARNYEGAMEKMAARHDALQEMVGRLLTVMMNNGMLRVEQVEEVLDYDFEVED